MSESATIERKLPPTERIAVKAKDAAALMSCSRSTFFARVKAGIYPKPGPDGTMGCAALGGARGTRKALQINSLRNPYHSGCHSTRRAWRGQGALSHGGHTSSIQCPSSMDRITSCQLPGRHETIRAREAHSSCAPLTTMGCRPAGQGVQQEWASAFQRQGAH